MGLLAGSVDERARMLIQAHIDDCQRQREEERRKQDAFRQEVSADIQETRTQIKSGFEDLHKRISGVKNWSIGIVIAIGGCVIVGLMSVLLSVLTKGLPWRQGRTRLGYQQTSPAPPYAPQGYAPPVGPQNIPPR